ncbi:MAG: hypothetical protein Q8K82_13540, partial [Gemmatimonadaceae bacterium]|nr:hypothetical protein [Gemmatimonadaceae bacterium]
SSSRLLKYSSSRLLKYSSSRLLKYSSSVLKRLRRMGSRNRVDALTFMQADSSIARYNTCGTRVSGDLGAALFEYHAMPDVSA